MVIWMVLGFFQVILPATAPDATSKGICNKPLGLGSGAVSDSSISHSEGAPFQGRLGDPAGAWCFGSDSIDAAVVTVDLTKTRFVSGFGSQGPPEKLHPKSYSHVVAYSAAHSASGKGWADINKGNLFFDTDRNDTSDVVSYFVSNTIVLARFVRINVTMQVSGSPIICLRFELYGCDTDVQPLTSLRALTTPQGQIEVSWDQPTADTTLEFESPSSSTFRPTGYAVLHRPLESQGFVSTVTTQRTLFLEDVRLGATYAVQLQCMMGDVSIDCGSTQVEAYPPCPDTWTGGNEYHCFLYLVDVTSFEDSKDACLGRDAEGTLGDVSYLVDDAERSFLASRILPDDATQLWLIGGGCQGNDECCNVLRKDEDGTLREAACKEEDLKSAVCVRDHKGEGSRIRVSSVKASAAGNAAGVSWRYEGRGWKTDKLQAKLWAESGVAMTTYTFSTLEDNFMLQGLEPGIMYSLVLKPAPNIRTEEFDYKFVIIDFGESSYGALLTPVPMSVYVIWSGILRVTWSVAEAHSMSGNVKESAKYSITHQMTAPDVAKQTEVIVESGYDFRLTPLAMQATYVFRLGCLFVGVYQPCGVATVRTDPPDYIERGVSGLLTLYEVITTTRRTWFDAEDDCQQRSGHLTSLLGESEGRTLLGILPTKDANVWTGAKLKSNGTSYWTDGNKITYLPMAKNSGVLPNQDSCCRALSEAGRLRLAGGPCGDLLHHMCKYSVRDILSPPKSLVATTQNWSSIEMKWQQPIEGWLPTFYSVKMCERKNPAECLVERDLKDQWSLKAENLKEFTAYDVTVKAVLQPIEVVAIANKTMYTYPKKPVRFTISPTGAMLLETPMLVAMEMADALVSASIYEGDNEKGASEGNSSLVSLTGLVPEERYRLVVSEKTDGQKKWTYETHFDAVPTCVTDSDAMIGPSCCRHVDSEVDFEGSRSRCVSVLQAPGAAVSPGGLYAADSSQAVEGLTNLTKYVGLVANFWVGRPAVDGVADTANEEECAIRNGDRECCSYVIEQKRIVCSYCCDTKQTILCAYKVKANIGQVADLLPSFIGNDSIGVRWSNPVDVTWNIQRYEVQWRSNEIESSDQVQTRLLGAARELLLEGLEYGTEYEVSVTPLGMEQMRGDASKLLVTTLDPRTPLTVVVQPDGVTLVSSMLLAEKGRGHEEVDVALTTLDPSRAVVAVVRGRAERVEVTGLEPGAEYAVEMTPAVAGRKPFNYSCTFRAFPSCAENQIQDGLVCLWAAEESKSWREAAEVCRGDRGQLLDFGTQKALAPAAKAQLAALVQKRFWMDLSSSETGTPAALVDGEECAGARESEIMCCTFEATPGGELDDLKCTCCLEPRPFACKRENTFNLGDIGEITVVESTQTSLKLGWTLDSNCKWQKPSFLVTWDSLSANKKRRKRAAPNQIVVKDEGTTIAGLKSATSYQVAVSPYTDGTQVSGAGKEINATTREEVIVAGFTDSGCTTTILKITCCVSMILGSSFTVFIFIATRMFDLDCVAQLFMELSLLGAYLCVLVSSAHTYSMDNECGRASPTLCVAVAGLLQFFFQSSFLFLLLESLVICTALKEYLPDCCVLKSPIVIAVVGFGIPAILNIVIAAIGSDEYTDKNENCWLYLQGRAVLPSVVPVLVFCACTCFLLLSAFDADEAREDNLKNPATRGRSFLKTRWSCFAVFVLTTVCYSTGVFGANSRDPTLNYVFVGFSIAFSILLPLLRIRCDDQVKEQLKRGLFASLREDVGGIRVMPAPENYDSDALLKMSEFSSPKFKQQQQLVNMAYKKREALVDPDPVLHR